MRPEHARGAPLQMKHEENIRRDAVQEMLRQLEGLPFWQERVLLLGMADYMQVLAYSATAHCSFEASFRHV